MDYDKNAKYVAYVQTQIETYPYGQPQGDDLRPMIALNVGDFVGKRDVVWLDWRPGIHRPDQCDYISLDLAHNVFTKSLHSKLQVLVRRWLDIQSKPPVAKKPHEIVCTLHTGTQSKTRKRPPPSDTTPERLKDMYYYLTAQEREEFRDWMTQILSDAHQKNEIHINTPPIDDRNVKPISPPIQKDNATTAHLRAFKHHFETNGHVNPAIRPKVDHD